MSARLLLVGILLLAAALRLWNLTSYPAGFTPDEASFGYDAYSILKTGKDQWGEVLPLAFRSFGDFKSPLYTYLTIPSVALFGLNEFAVRLPNAVLGILAVLVTYLLVVELIKREAPRQPPGSSGKSTRGRALALIAAFLLAVSPWHISLSRGAFEANLTTFLMPLGIYAFLRGLREDRWMIISALAFGLNLFSYHSARFITPILVLMLVFTLRKHFTPRNNSVTLALVIFFLFFSLSVFQFFSGAGTRASDIGIFNPTGGWGAVADRRYEAVQTGLPDEIARVFSNKLISVGSEFVKNYLSYLSPTFLFTQGAGEATYGMIPGHGVVYLLELPFLIAALWLIVRRPANARWIILLIVWCLLSPIPAALTKGPGFAANRAAVAMPALQILSAYGAVILLDWWKQNKKLPLKRFLPFGYSAIGLLGILFFFEAYFFHGPRINGHSMSYGWREAMGYIQSVEGKYDDIIISRALSEPHIFVAFYNKWDPLDYQKQSKDWLRYEKQGLLFVDQLGEWRLGKYIFRDMRYSEDSELKGTLLVGRARDFSENVMARRKIEYPDGRPAIFIVDLLSK